MRNAGRIPVSVAAAAFAAALFCSGCLSPVMPDGRLKHKQFEVRGSGLDWIAFVYTPAPESRAIPHVCRLELYGSGMAQLKTGPSPQVRDDFATDHSDPRWNDLESDSIAMTPDQMREVMQVFVDEGIVAEYPQSVSAERLPAVVCTGKVNTEKFFLSTDNAPLVETVEDFIETNFPAAIRRSARWPRETSPKPPSP